MNEYLVSVLCVTYNHEAYISKMIEGVLMQKVNFEYELLIGEDCSTDGTRAVVESYRERYPDIIKIVTSDKNVGARNNGLRVFQAAKGKYMALCEGDDYWTDPLKLQMQVDYMEANPDCSFTFHSSSYVDAEGEKVGRMIRPYTQDRLCPTRDVIVGGGSFTATAAMVYRKSMMDVTPQFYQEAIVGDYPRQIILASHGHVYYFDRDMSDYRFMHPGSWSNRQKDANKAIYNANKMIEVLDGFNTYSKRRFHDAVDDAKKFFEFKIALLSNDLGTMLEKRYRDIWRSNSCFFKLKTILRCKMPNLYGYSKRLILSKKGS